MSTHRDTQRTVVVIGPLPPPFNGMTVATMHLLNASRSDRYRVLHLDTSDHRPIDRVGHVDVVNAWLAVCHGVRCLVLLSRFRPLCVHVPLARNRLGFTRDALFLVSARITHTRCVLHFHSRDFIAYYEAEPAVFRLLIRFALGRTSRAIVLGRSRMHDFGHLIPADRVHVVPNGVPDVGAGEDPGRRERVALHLTNLSEKKGVFDFLEAARRIVPEVPDARFVLAGGWLSVEDRERATAFVSTHRLGSAISILGEVHGAEKDSLLREAAVMGFPTHHHTEGHPLVVLEALSAATPVVASSVGAIPETITNGREGYLIREGDVDALTEHLRRLLEDPALRSELGRSARARYEQAYTVERFADRCAAVWDAVREEERRTNGGRLSR